MPLDHAVVDGEFPPRRAIRLERANGEAGHASIGQEDPVEDVVARCYVPIFVEEQLFSCRVCKMTVLQQREELKERKMD